jgi:hypothetical protein
MCYSIHMAKQKPPLNPNFVVDNEAERAYWCELFGCTPQELRAVLRFTDETPEQVRAALEVERKRR